jgi:5-methyltetrahydrofolate--homocysteine methyltransferase
MRTMAFSYLEAVQNRVLVFDGAAGTWLQLHDLQPDDYGSEELDGCPEILNESRPELIRQLHTEYLDAGADIIETNTFGGMRATLNEYGLGDRTEELNEMAALIARQAADDYSTPEKPRFVAGSIGPGTRFASLGHVRYEELRDQIAEQSRGLIRGGVDVLLLETQFDLLGIKAGMNGCRDAMREVGREVPIQVQVTIELTGRMLPGTEIGAALVALDAMKPDVIGINCATGPEEMSEHIRHLSQHSRIPISVLPNAGLPSVVDGHMHYDLSAEQFVEFHKRFVTEFGVTIVGGCCGTTPEYIRQLAEAVKDLQPLQRTPVFEHGVASIYSPVTLGNEDDSATNLLLIGERTNANGSKKFKEAMLDSDWDTCVAMAKEQVKEGSHIIDVCVDYVGRDGAGDMDEIAQRFATQASVPLVLDSTEPEVLEAGLRWLGGRAILNSANLEDSDAEGSRADKVFKLAQEFGAAVICLLIDEEGQARDVEWKMRVAHRIHDLAVGRYGLEPQDLIFDALTFPLSTGDDDLRKDAIATIEAIRRIKTELPGVSTTLGLSNVSFGLKPAARHVLNSVFLAECTKAGLDSAIVHAAKILPLSRIPQEQRDVCLDLIWDRRGTEGLLADGDAKYDPLMKLLEIFADVQTTAVVVEDRTDWTIDHRLSQRIIDGDRDGLIPDLETALAEGYTPLQIINDVLLAGMKVVGELFASGEMQLPFVLQSAETMKSAVAFLEPMMERAEGETGKGRIVLATVKGDVHDIGKNLVDIILTNNGYEVHNLGIKISITEMIDKALEIKADAIGMSGLLVKSTLIMRDNLAELNSRGLQNIPVLLGGAALTRTYVERDLREVYEGRLFYGKDAFEGLRVMDRLGEIRVGKLDVDDGMVPTEKELHRHRVADEPAEPVEIPSRSPEATMDNEIFVPPFLGSKVIKGISLDDIAAYINETALFRNQWQFRPEVLPDGSKETDEQFKDRIRPTLREQLAEAKEQGLLIPQVVYGFYAVNGDGNDLVVFTDETRTSELMRFSYPRQSVEPFLCISDFFRPIESGEADYAAFHIVTMGAAVSERAAELFAENRYQEYLLLHGLGVEMAEALAEFWHRRIREEWGFADQDPEPIVGSPSQVALAGLFRQKYRSGRYSWGYPACPDLEDNEKVALLLESSRIGVECTEETSFQYQPEQTTSALICHHPRAKYFVAK